VRRLAASTLALLALTGCGGSSDARVEARDAAGFRRVSRRLLRLLAQSSDERSRLLAAPNAHAEPASPDKDDEESLES
jgi:hypothetical protein